MGHTGLFCLFSLFSTNLQNWKLERDSNLDQHGVKGEHADHLTTTTTTEPSVAIVTKLFHEWGSLDLDFLYLQML